MDLKEIGVSTRNWVDSTQLYFSGNYTNTQNQIYTFENVVHIIIIIIIIILLLLL